MRILITGGTGQVGTELAAYSWPGAVRAVCPDRAELDLVDAPSIAAYVSAGNFAAVINPAAYTAVDKAENDVVNAFAVNAMAPAALAAVTRTLGIPLIHVSTDYVFAGKKPGAYRENDPVGPLGVYGASKEAGEQAVRTGNPRHVILRTAWVFSPHGANFVKTMLRLGADRPLLRVVDDQRGCPTAAADIAAALARITLRMIGDIAAPSGTYHFVGAGETTWCAFAREIFRWQAEAGLAVPEVEAISTSDYPTPARRPANSVLAVERLVEDYGIRPRPWQEALNETLAALGADRQEQRLANT